MKKLLQRLPVLHAFFAVLILSGSLILLDPSPAWAIKCRAEVTCGNCGKVSCEADGPNAQCEASQRNGEVRCYDGDGWSYGFCRE
ncbi:hypothetical protein SAMN04488087_1616 [Rhodothermus profundi]|uniref:Uncharacterized protein n=1 Tax=Rhodothermus profundi TaxID=633813 RepID=A0A1M6U155_9BACT|nr:hypothetical protein SAMN04488087_1616 [Rhodothermus profundi]